MTGDAKGKYLTCVLTFLVSLFMVSLFKNISHPLFWADESMTVMHGQRVLEYGYPKVHDGKNVLYDLRHPNPTLGIDEETDAFIGGANWGQYYLAAIGVKLAEISDDLFTRTGIIRSLFALIGLSGLALSAFLTSRFFGTGPSKVGFLAFFVFLELISVPLVLHLRQARYYPMTLFFVVLTVFAYTQYRILNRTRYPGFIAFLTASLFLLFFTFSPAYFILLATIFLFESLVLAARFFQRQNIPGETLPQSFTPIELFKDYLKVMLPLVLSLIAAAPLLSFFKMFYIADKMSRFNILSSTFTDGMHMYLDHLATLWRYFARDDLIYLAISMKLCLLSCLALKLFNKSLPSLHLLKVSFSNFLTILFIVYFFAIAMIPNFLFTRYFIPLQPILTLIIILDAAAIYDVISRWRSAAAVYYKGALIFLCTGFVVFNIATNAEVLKGHVYEVLHPYRGPLDYVIPFVEEEFDATDSLVIATNYEETSFMYYLDAEVIVGLLGNNLKEDAAKIPDIIVYRKAVSRDFADVFSAFFTRAQYGRILFPVVDRPPNNTPELNCPSSFAHRFRTEETANNGEKVAIYLRM